MLGDLVGHERSAWQFDHRADLDRELDASRFALLVHHFFDQFAHATKLFCEANEWNHDLWARITTGGLDRDRRTHNRTGLHFVDLREQKPQPAATRSQHRVRLGQLFDTGQQCLSRLQVARRTVLADALNVD